MLVLPDWGTSEHWARRALTEAEGARDGEGVALARMGAAHSGWIAGRTPDTAIAELHQSIAEASAAKWMFTLSKSQILLGRVYAWEPNAAQARQWLETGLRNAALHGPPGNVAFAQLNLAVLWLNAGECMSALRYLEACIAFYRVLGMPVTLSLALLAKGEALVHVGT